MALSVPRLLRGARCMYGRRSLRGFVLGSGSIMSSLVGARSSAGIYPTIRLLRWWWKRRGRSSHLRSLLLRWHVDEDVDVARADAESDMHDLDAPLPGAPKMSWLGTSTYGAGGPFWSGKGAEGARRGDRGGSARGILPSFGALRRDKTPTAALCFYSVLARERRCVVVLNDSNEPNPFYVRMGLLFIV